MKRLLVILFLLLGQGNLFAQLQVDVKFNYHRGSYKGSYYDVIVTQNGKTYNLTFFKPWEEITNVLLSPDNNYLLVRHRPQHGRYYLWSLYDLRTRRLIKRIPPNAGGDIAWNKNMQIIHRWGCGTNCAPLAVYDNKLKKIFYTLSSGGYATSPDGNYIVQFAMHEDEMWVYDLASLKTGKYPKTYHALVDTSYAIWNLNSDEHAAFISNNKFRMVKRSGSRQPLVIDLTKVKWKRTDPRTIGEFYERRF